MCLGVFEPRYCLCNRLFTPNYEQKETINVTFYRLTVLKLPFIRNFGPSDISNVIFRAKYHPAKLGYNCTRMSLRLSEEYKWESMKCDKQAATFAICQFHLDEATNSPAIEKHGKTSSFPNYIIAYPTRYSSIFTRSESESELLLVTHSNDNHSPGIFVIVDITVLVIPSYTRGVR